MTDLTYPEKIARLAGPRHFHDTRESWLGRAAAISGVNYRTVKALFYGETTDPKQSIRDQIESALQKRTSSNIRAVHDKLSAIKAACSALEAELEALQSAPAQISVHRRRVGDWVSGGDDFNHSASEHTSRHRDGAACG